TQLPKMRRPVRAGKSGRARDTLLASRLIRKQKEPLLVHGHLCGWRLWEGLLDNLQEKDAVLLGNQVGDLLVGLFALVEIEDSDLLHPTVENTPAGSLPRRLLFLPRLFRFWHCRFRLGCLPGRACCVCAFPCRWFRGIGLLTQLASIQNAACHEGPLS